MSQREEMHGPGEGELVLRATLTHTDDELKAKPGFQDWRQTMTAGKDGRFELQIVKSHWISQTCKVRGSTIKVGIGTLHKLDGKVSGISCRKWSLSPGRCGIAHRY
jgi:hypothetical protein